MSADESEWERTEWYWDLRRGRAVPADERGPGEDMLGPYPTKGEAENWRSKVESRNEEWEADDEEWDAWGSDEEPPPAGD